MVNKCLPSYSQTALSVFERKKVKGFMFFVIMVSRLQFKINQLKLRDVMN